MRPIRFFGTLRYRRITKSRRPDLVVINKKKKTCPLVDFAVLADHRVKLKEIEKKDKYLDLARKLKKKNYGT